MQSETPSMKIRSYFSHSVEQAIQEARRELGPDAMLITSRRAAPHDRHLGSYEVVFGTTSDDVTPAAAPHDLNREVAALRDQMESIKRALVAGPVSAGLNNSQPEFAQVHQQLISAGLEATLAQSIIDEASISICQLTPAQRASAASIEELVVQTIGKKLRFACDSTSGVQSAKRIVVLVGPPGAGKTATLAKVAIQNCLGPRVSARIISVDPYRVGTHERLRSLAKIMGIGFTASSTIREFTEVVDEFRNKDILLIDTPGFSGNEIDSARDLASCLSQLNFRETHLVLPAWMSAKNQMRYVRQYEVFQPDYLLFTKLDEIDVPGACLGAAIESNKPVSYFATGQSIPEDIQPASAEPLLRNLFAQRAAASSAA